MFLKNIVVEKNKEVKSDHFIMSFKDKEIAEDVRKGQFVELKINDGLGNLLRKPISIHDVYENKVSLLYKVIGKGTKALSKYKKGEELSILGPLGNGFPNIADDKEILLVAGGIGFAPFSLIMREVKNWKLFYGFRDASEFLLEGATSDIHYENEQIFITTDNGSMGTKGFVTDKLEEYLRENSQNKIIFSCGPNIMMKKVAEIANQYNVVSYLSLEEYMGCGIGVCAGCVAKIKNPDKPDGWEFKKVCKDGPVFRGDEIIWD
ncbi:MAG TPA: dihydroorotate dehydrogenase electron transfer subunit [Chloroflexi bacterium]|nr:dihydroorotate dehydrogenase electron transfer subunit [Chloroflexota bacterium]